MQSKDRCSSAVEELMTLELNVLQVACRMISLHPVIQRRCVVDGVVLPLSVLSYDDNGQWSESIGCLVDVVVVVEFFKCGDHPHHIPR
jgi:hypothetical protein